MAVKLTKIKELELCKGVGCVVKDKGKPKNLILTLHPEGHFTLRPKGTRKGGEAEITGMFSRVYNDLNIRRCT
tara:strand:+ start:1268 stop:1486 length:219 start_codon:yes stop_codon:yes gene_type:complete